MITWQQYNFPHIIDFYYSSIYLFFVTENRGKQKPPFQKTLTPLWFFSPFFFLERESESEGEEREREREKGSGENDGAPYEIEREWERESEANPNLSH